MTDRPNLLSWRDLDLDPLHWAREAIRILGKSLSRLWGRDVMLYTGGVSFFALLAVFPGVAILIGLYSLLLTPEQAAHRAEAFAQLLPARAQDLVTSELTRLAHAPGGAISAQSGLALIIGLYAAHRGFKALLAGLSFIHDDDKPRGFVGFNIMALVVLIVAVILLTLLSALFLTLRVMAIAMHLKPLEGVSWFYSEWTWATFGITLGLSLIYRFAMARSPVGWRASITGGIAAAIVSLLASWGCAFYVEQIAQLGATYGSVAAVVVLLIWLSWTVNAVFFGGALATEVEIAIRDHVLMKPTLLTDQRGKKARVAGPPES